MYETKKQENQGDNTNTDRPTGELEAQTADNVKMKAAVAVANNSGMMHPMLEVFNL
eukprot:CAMPEP_0116890938 /NCGR_PEP_ID=MMETSP0467-20121206/1432_1 /TAXON_ID=283647 /ORGANISM="Mesodinium pulex, Strain SPMC105" /LENGTH=55 /DNA_ID=CAMNT_0004559109 /DNA_START=1920 /DNA_END=2087 /DNA_ORIENTATION=+